METIVPVYFEDTKTLMEISKLKSEIKKLYHQKGPWSSDYIALSIKLDVLINEYIEEKIINLA